MNCQSVKQNLLPQVLAAVVPTLEERVLTCSTYITKHIRHLTVIMGKEQTLYLSRQITGLPCPIELRAGKDPLIHVKWPGQRAISFQTAELINPSEPWEKKKVVDTHKIPYVLENEPATPIAREKCQAILLILQRSLEGHLAQCLQYLDTVISQKDSEDLKCYLKRKKTGLAFPVFLTEQENYIILRWKLNKGSYKKVSLAVSCTKTVQLLAALITKTKSLKDWQIHETQILAQLQGMPGIIPTEQTHIQLINTQFHILIIQHLANQGDLLSKVMFEPLEEKQVVQIACDLLLSLKTLHENKFVHCDIKLGNVLLNKQERLHAFFTDFSFTRPMNTEKRYLQGTFEMISPEVFFLILCNEKSVECLFHGARDIFALGLTLYSALKGIPHRWQLLMRTVKCNSNEENINEVYKYVREEKQNPEPQNKGSLEHLIWQMLATRPEKRITADAAYEIALSLQRAPSSQSSGNARLDSASESAGQGQVKASCATAAL